MKSIDRNLTMLCDFYELTMANGYLKSGIGEQYTYFDVFYRNNPDNAGYAVVANSDVLCGDSCLLTNGGHYNGRHCFF